SERIPAAAGIVNLRYKSCPEMAGQDQHPFLQDFSYLMQVRENHYTKRAGVMGIRACAEGYNG
ncbi:hypothetical protein KD910_20970, partial [Klebsiella pneumoniae]|nr:hypothetical protein [Klebsiella pneumoniae]MBV2002681.1 hypothetical protein [Klebsiella pneumoniae]MBV2023890.1 hypothetical protein [Klebsiella pneumoniae]